MNKEAGSNAAKQQLHTGPVKSKKCPSNPDYTLLEVYPLAVYCEGPETFIPDQFTVQAQEPLSPT